MCVCVTTPNAIYIPTYLDDTMKQGAIMHCVDIIENASLKSSGNTCSPPWPSSLLDELRDSYDGLEIVRNFESRSELLITEYCISN